MDKRIVKNALQDLIIRLQDAEKGYSKIKEETNNPILANWMERYAAERHSMHQVLESYVEKYDGNAEVMTSFLGDLHRIFMDVKFSVVDADYDAIVNEIKRGSDVLIRDYEKVLNGVTMDVDLRVTLQQQLELIKKETESLKSLQEEINSVTA